MWENTFVPGMNLGFENKVKILPNIRGSFIFADDIQQQKTVTYISRYKVPLFI